MGLFDKFGKKKSNINNNINQALVDDKKNILNNQSEESLTKGEDIDIAKIVDDVRKNENTMNEHIEESIKLQELLDDNQEQIDNVFQSSELKSAMAKDFEEYALEEEKKNDDSKDKYEDLTHRAEILIKEYGEDSLENIMLKEAQNSNIDDFEYIIKTLEEALIEKKKQVEKEKDEERNDFMISVKKFLDESKKDPLIDVLKDVYARYQSDEDKDFWYKAMREKFVEKLGDERKAIIYNHFKELQKKRMELFISNYLEKENQEEKKVL